MRNALIVATMLAVTSLSSAQQATTQYLISTRILAGNLLEAGSVQVLASPTFRVQAGRAGTMDLGDAATGLRVAVTPSDLGAGRVALRVVTETRRNGQVQVSIFDLLTGADTSTPTVALRDSAGAFMSDGQGRPLFVEFQTTVRR